jgi:hypothetical protein
MALRREALSALHFGGEISKIARLFQARSALAPRVAGGDVLRALYSGEI